MAECDRKFLNDLKISILELQDASKKLLMDLREILLTSFKVKSKEELAKVFNDIEDYIDSQELKILLNNIVDIDISEELWINRIATFINKFRVPKDWSDEDYTNFKISVKELAHKFFALEATVGVRDSVATNKYYAILDKVLNLSKEEQMLLLRVLANN